MLTSNELPGDPGVLLAVVEEDPAEHGAVVFVVARV